MKEIHFHGYEPYIGSNFKSAAPNGIWLRHLFRTLSSNGLDPYWIGEDHDVDSDIPTKPMSKVGDAHLVVLFWRWRMPAVEKYAARNSAYDHQIDLMVRCHKLGIPMLIHDQDMMMTPEERELAVVYGATLTMPAERPPKGYLTLHYPVWSPPVFSMPTGKFSLLVYVGNNYGRYELAKKYLNIGVPNLVHVFGNWLENDLSGIRESPERVQEDFPNVKFHPTLSQRNVKAFLEIASFTIHLAKPGYLETGFMAIRWIEAVMYGTAAMIPRETKIDPSILGRVSNRYEVLGMLKRWDDPDYMKMVYECQKEFVMDRCRVEKWVQLLGALA